MHKAVTQYEYHTRSLRATLVEI